MAWYTLAEEADLLDAAATTGLVAVDTIGESELGRPIRRVRLGDPPPPPSERTVFLTGCVHGVEPAGRQALLDLIADVSTGSTLSTAQLAFISQHGMICIPTVNPDGFEAETRDNASGVDINRDFMALESVEARIVSAALAEARPVIMWDLHEYLPDPDDSLVVQVNRAFTAQGHEDPKARALTLRDQMLTRATNEGWNNDVWGATFRGDITLLDISAQLRHCVSGIVETNRTDDTDTNRLFRAEVQYAMIEEIIDFAIDATVPTLIDEAEGAAADKAAEGVAGVEPFDLRDGGTLDPPPLAYDLADSASASVYLAGWNIQIQGNRITMGQQAQPVIPYLFDPDSPYRVATAQRVFILQPPQNGITPQELAPVLSGSHRVVVEARVLTRFQVGGNPDGVIIPVLGGDVTFDSTAQVFASLHLETEGADERGNSLFPRRASDLLAPYGHELFVRAGVDIGETILWSPLGYFRIDSDEQQTRARNPIVLSAPDRMRQIVDSRLVRPIQFDADVTVGDAVDALVKPVYPAATVVFDDSSGDPLGRDIVIEEDRYEGLLDIVESLGKVVYFDGEGVLRIENEPDPDEIVWEVRAGRGGVLVDANREVSREGMRNGWRATGEGASETPVSAVVVDTGPNSPTRWFPPDDPAELWFGQIPGFYSSPLLTSGNRARRAAESKLRRYIGMPYRVNFGSVPNVALRPRHAVRFTYDDGNREKHLIETLSIPLVADAAMTGTTREQTLVQIGQI